MRVLLSVRSVSVFRGRAVVIFRLGDWREICRNASSLGAYGLPLS